MISIAYGRFGPLESIQSDLSSQLQDIARDTRMVAVRCRPRPAEPLFLYRPTFPPRGFPHLRPFIASDRGPRRKPCVFNGELVAGARNVSNLLVIPFERYIAA